MIWDSNDYQRKLYFVPQFIKRNKSIDELDPVILGEV